MVFIYCIDRFVNLIFTSIKISGYVRIDNTVRIYSAQSMTLSVNEKRLRDSLPFPLPVCSVMPTTSSLEIHYVTFMLKCTIVFWFVNELNQLCGYFFLIDESVRCDDLFYNYYFNFFITFFIFFFFFRKTEFYFIEIMILKIR